MKKYLSKQMICLFMAVLLLAMSGCSSPADESATKDSTASRQDGTGASNPASGKEDAGAYGLASPKAAGLSKEEFRQAEDAMEHLLTVWSDYLRVQEEMYASELWALDYVEKYLESGDWNDLNKARTACIASARFLSDLSMAEEDITDEEYTALAKTGMDVTYQSAEFEAVPSKVESEHTFVRNRMLESLEGLVFFSRDRDLMQEAVSIQKEYIAYYCECECIFTNYLLLMSGDEETASVYWEALPEKYPVLSTGIQNWNNSDTALEIHANQCLDNIEDTTLRQADLLSASGAELYKMTKAVENQDIGEWIEAAFIMENTPELLPMPEWYEPETARYLSFITEEDGTVTYPESGDELGDASYGVYMQIPDISAAEIHAYAAAVQQFAQDVWKSEGVDEWNIKMADYSVQISLEDGTATVLFHGEDVTFAPVWYMAAGR